MTPTRIKRLKGTEGSLTCSERAPFYSFREGCKRGVGAGVGRRACWCIGGNLRKRLLEYPVNGSVWAKIFIERVEKKLIENALGGAITGCVCCFLN